MTRRHLSPLGLIVVGLLGIAALTVTWIRASAMEIAGKPVTSDRNRKTEITPVRW